MIYEEEDYLLLSGIQHYAFCPRQWALIHIEEQWNENYLTTGGRIMHNKAHDGEAVEKRGDLITFRGLKVCSAELGLTGQCDIVEFHRNSNGVTLMGYEGFWHPYPVEYKRGKSKLEDCDKLQLCAQAVCLEEMLCVKIDSGALYYGEPHKREKVTFTHELREELEDSVRTMHEMFKRQHTPKVKKKKSCQSCSIKDLCLPKLGELAKTSVKEYLEVHLE